MYVVVSLILLSLTQNNASFFVNPFQLRPNSCWRFRLALDETQKAAHTRGMGKRLPYTFSISFLEALANVRLLSGYVHKCPHPCSISHSLVWVTHISCCFALETQQSSSSSSSTHRDVYGVSGGVFFLTWSPLNCILLFCRAWAPAYQQSPAASEAAPTRSVGFHLSYPPLQVFTFLLKGKHIVYVYFSTSIFEKHSWVFYIPLCSNESMWSGIWFVQ